LVTDNASGRIYVLTADALTDNGNSIVRQVVSETIAQNDLSYFAIDCLRLDVETGVGLATGQGSDPQIGLEVSRDNGQTWGAQMWKSLGKIGEYADYVEWRRLGTARQFTFRWTLSDPVPLTIVSSSINPNT
jgi:hypothetical protein